MPEDEEIRAKFWKALRSDMVVMLGLEGAWAEPPRPMTAQVLDDADHGPLWFFTAKSTALAQALTATGPALFTFVSKGHDVFATVHGNLTPDTDPAMVERLGQAGLYLQAAAGVMRASASVTNSTFGRASAG